MSVRAHRVDEIKTNGCSFNLWYDKDVCRWLRDNTLFYYNLTQDCGGITDVSVADLKAMLTEIGETMTEEVKEAIWDDINFAEAKGEEYILYYCF